MDSRNIRSRLALATLVACSPIAVLAENPGDRIDTPSSPTMTTSDDHSDRPTGPSPAPRTGPWISGRAASPVRSKLESSFEMATQRLEEAPECRALFVNLGVDGLEMLSTTLYYPASLKLERQLCPRAFAWTTVGGAPTFMCRRFSKLSDKRAAAVLIHEALHHAGMGEWPNDPVGLPPAAIDDLVEEACGF